MKVRHKLTGYGEVWDVLDEGKEYYILQSPKDVHGAARIGHAKKSSVEVVPDEPRWQDVTGECEIASNGDVRHGDLIFLAEFHGRHTYRLRKVQLKREQGEHLSDLTVWAFIVERKLTD